MSEDRFQSWGRQRGGVGRRAIEALQARPLRKHSDRLLPFGNGRSYGDSCHNDAGQLIDSRSANRILAFHPLSGIMRAEAGTLLSDITRRAAPHGWFLPVTPGTQHVTLGGCIANDVHGKNHHRRGTFGSWVRSLEIERSDRGRLVCGAGQNADLFRATISGMGLTGLILKAEIQLMRVESPTIRQTVTRFERLADYFEMAEAADERHEYAVAWIDSLARGRSFGRGHMIAGDHAPGGDKTGAARPPLASVPWTPPVSPLSGVGLKLFNEAYFRKAPAGTSERTVPFDAFFYPLDRIGRWNRLYGPNGLHQHQSVVPYADAQGAVSALIECARSYGQGSFLTVLKRFGDRRSPGLMSFPRPGYTLTLDFPNRGESTLRMLDELDAITVTAGGAVNPYKDARMSAATFAAFFPQWRRLEAFRDPCLVSDFWRRTALALPADAGAMAAE